MSSLLLSLRLRAPPPLPSFPTRRSSDLARQSARQRGPGPVGGRRGGHLGLSGTAHLARAGGAARPVEPAQHRRPRRDRKSTRLNSSHVETSYAVFCLKKKTRYKQLTRSR